MVRWEYKVLALRGSYTETLNEYGREGWELVSVASDVRGPSAPTSSGSSVPLPRAFGRLEDAAARLKKLGTDDPGDPAEAATTTTLLWVLRRPLNDD
jgi:Domain of unknown function (DUF4177)